MLSHPPTPTPCCPVPPPPPCSACTAAPSLVGPEVPLCCRNAGLQVAASFLVWRGGCQLPATSRPAHLLPPLWAGEQAWSPARAPANPLPRPSQPHCRTAPLLWFPGCLSLSPSCQALPSADNHQPVLTEVSSPLPGPAHGATSFWFLRVWWAEGRGTFVGVTRRPSATPWRPLPPPDRFPKKLPFALFAPLIHSGCFSGLNCWMQVGSPFIATHTHEGWETVWS